jgi:NACHT domain
MSLIKVCSSAIIQDVLQHCQSYSELAVVYFYFDFNDVEKQRHENLIRSLIVQLSMQSTNTPEALNTIYSRCQEGQQQPTTDALILTLQHMLVDFDQTFIILDALDECKEREELLELLEKFVDWKLNGSHILATSRREKDIEETLEPLITGQICIQSAVVNADIQICLRERLQYDPKLRKWPVMVQKEIETTLMDGAHGM